MFGKFSIILSVGISIVLGYFGMDYIARKWPSLSATNPVQSEVSYKRLFTLHSLRGPRAILFGAACILGAIVIIAPWVIGVVNQNTAPTDDVVLFAAVIGLTIPVLGFALAFFFEFLATVRLLAARRIKKGELRRAAQLKNRK